ncbi:MAG: tol-pal system-associated acyl-CoA thioesterase [Zoogloeaceae bacterium]|jgi:acyl-CoA thioester hydrolase|nr:tol-pal system-associated acyl-CoA thioesterase [Zoogloeaceae bacterium]
MNTTRFSIPVRVYYEDTDSGGVVFYVNYFKFMERCRTEWLRSLGHEQRQLTEEEGILFVVRNASAEYKRPARLDDALIVDLRVESIGRSQLAVVQRVCRATAAGELEELVIGTTQVVCVDISVFKPIPIPAGIRQQLEQFR